MCTAGAIPFWGFAQYPEKPITLLVGYGAGSAGDQIARGLAAAASKRLRQPILVVNRSSASGTHAIALGVFYDHRLKLGMSGVPTFKERGFEILLTTGQAVVAPHGTPASNVRILDEMVRKAVAEPSFVSLAERTQNTIDYKGQKSSLPSFGENSRGMVNSCANCESSRNNRPRRICGKMPNDARRGALRRPGESSRTEFPKWSWLAY